MLVFSCREPPSQRQKTIKLLRMRQYDHLFVTFTNTILNGWPEQRTNCPRSIAEFRNHRDELAIINGIVFRGQCLVIPHSLMPSMLESIYMGMVKCIRRAKDIMFWPKLVLKSRKK